MKTKDRILLAAKELFYRYGIKSVTMDDIAKHLSIAKKTIYHFFKNKEDIVRAFANASLLENQQRMKKVSASSENAIDEIMQIMNHLKTMFAQMNPNLFYDLRKHHHESWKQFGNFKEKFILNKIETNLQKGIKQKLYRKDINVKILARLRIEEVEMVFNSEIFPHDKYNFTAVQVALLDHFLHGITTLKGHKLINRYKQIVEEE